MKDNTLDEIFRDDHLLTYLLLTQFHNNATVGIILNTIYELIKKDMSYFDRVVKAVSYIAMIDEWPESDKKDSMKELLKDR